MTDERNLTEDDVRHEHLQAVNQGVQAIYLAGVILGGLFLMLLLIAFLGSSSG